MKILLLLILLLIPIRGYSSELLEKLKQKWRWVEYNEESGLPSVKAVRIVEANDGTIWACTIKGFAWFDGYIWHHVKSDSIKFNYIEMWIAEPNFEEGLITTYKGNLAKIYQDTIILDTNFGGQNIKEVITYKDKKYLLKVENEDKKYSKIYVYDGKNIKALENSPLIKLIKNHYRSIYRDNSGNIWLNFEKGLFQREEGKWVLKKENIISEPFDLTKPLIDESGNAFIAIGFPEFLKAIWIKVKNENRFKKFKDIFSISRDLEITNDKELLSLNDLAIFEIIKDRVQESFSDFPMNLVTPIRIALDSYGDLWVSGEKGLFLCKLSSSRWEYTSWEKDLAKNYINELEVDSKSTILTTDNSVEILKKSNESLTISKLKGKTFKGATGLLKQNKDIWITSGAEFTGIYRFDGFKWFHHDITYEGVGVNFHKIRKDNSDNMWFLSLSNSTQFNGFGAYQKIDGTYKNWNLKDGLLSNRVYDFLEDSIGAYWFATMEGLCRKHEGKWTYWTIDNGLKTSRIYAIAVDKNNKLWFSDYFTGVGYIENDSVIYSKVLDDAEIFKVKNLLFDERNNLWMTSKSGVYYLNGDAVAKFNKINGMSSTSAWPIKIFKDKIYIGTLGGGLNILNPYESDEPLPKIYLNPIRENNDNYYFSWKVFAFRGQIPSEEIEVRYKIDNEEWSPWTNDREITREDLNFGEHRFYIQAKGLFGDYNSTKITRKFYVSLPLYYSPYFLFPMFSLVVVLIYLISYIRKRRKEKENLLIQNKNNLEIQVKEQTASLREALYKLQIEIQSRENAEEELTTVKDSIRDAYYKERELNVIQTNTLATLSQSFKGPLTIISNSNELIKYYVHKNEIDKTFEKIENINDSTAILLETIDNLILSGELSTNNSMLIKEEFALETELNKICSLFQEITKYDISIIELYNTKNTLINSEKNIFKQLIINILDNAAKYSDENQVVKIYTNITDNNITVRISDSGRGIPDYFISQIYEPFLRADNVRDINGYGVGLTLVKKAADALNITLEYKSELDKGTSVDLIIDNDDVKI